MKRYLRLKIQSVKLLLIQVSGMDNKVPNTKNLVNND